MSEESKSPKPVTDEDIIEDLTKDLKNSLKTADDPAEFVVNPGPSAADAPTDSGDAAKMTDIPLDDNDLDQDHIQKDSDSDTDSINEEALKDAELDLTDDQKEERRIIAEELKETGNYGFKIGDYKWSVEKYTSGLQTCPLHYTKLRAILYCNRSAARMKQEKYDKAIKDCTKAIELDDQYVKAYIRRAQSYEATDKLDESLADFKKVLELEPSQSEAQKAVKRLPPLIEEKNEKLKTEMLGKLKDLGNMILKPFGLSTNNFQMEQDPETKDTMARCRRRRKMCRTRCRSRTTGRFKRCRSCDRRYPVRQRYCRRRRPRRSYRRRRRPGRRCGRPRYNWRCRSRSGSFKRCRSCDRRHKVRRRRCRSRS